MQKYMIAFALILLSLFADAFPVLAQCRSQSDGHRPSWISNVKDRPKNTPNSDFIVISAQGATLTEARAVADAEVEVAQRNRTGRWTGESNPSDIQVRYQCESEHYEVRGGRYYLWRLVQIAKRPHVELDPVPVRQSAKTDRNTIGLKPFVPGMAQIHRADNVSGALFIVGVSALSVGAVTTEMLRADNNDKVKTTYNVAQRQKYMDDADTYQTARNVLMISAGAVYLWNVIDGYVGGKGRQYSAMDSDVKIIPYADSHGGGLMLGFNF